MYENYEYKAGAGVYHFQKSRVFYMSSGSEMTAEDLEKALAWHKRLVRDTLAPLGRMYEVDSEIFHKPPADDDKPDIRVSAAHCKVVVDEFVGYLCGIPVKTGGGSDEVHEYLSFLERTTGTDGRTADLVQDACIFGRSFEMYYNGDDGEIGVVPVSPLDSFIIYDDSVLHRPLYFVRYGVGADKIERGSFSDAEAVYHFVAENGRPVIDPEGESHSFPGVPAVEYVLCKQRLGLYEPGVSLENAFNAALSEKANDIAAFADAYMEITGAPVDENEIPMIKRRRILNFQGTGDGNLPRIGFLARPTADELEEHFLDRTEQLFFRACQIPDLSDEHFGTASGEALKWRLLGMDNLAASVKRSITESLKRRYKLIFGNPISLTHGVQPDDWLDLSIHWTRNLPTNVSDEADTASKLEGIVSRETQLSVLSIVDSVPDELARLEEERQAEIEAVSSYTIHDHDHEESPTSGEVKDNGE